MKALIPGTPSILVEIGMILPHGPIPLEEHPVDAFPMSLVKCISMRRMMVSQLH